MKNFERSAFLARELKGLISVNVWEKLPAHQLEAIDQIMTQVSQILSGETFTPWASIAEYAKSVLEVELDLMEDKEKKEAPIPPVPPVCQSPRYFGDPPIQSVPPISEKESDTPYETRYCLDCSSKLPLHFDWCIRATVKGEKGIVHDA